MGLDFQHDLNNVKLVRRMANKIYFSTRYRNQIHHLPSAMKIKLWFNTVMTCAIPGSMSKLVLPEKEFASLKSMNTWE